MWLQIYLISIYSSSVATLSIYWFHEWFNTTKDKQLALMIIICLDTLWQSLVIDKKKTFFMFFFSSCIKIWNCSPLSHVGCYFLCSYATSVRSTSIQYLITCFTALDLCSTRAVICCTWIDSLANFWTAKVLRTWYLDIEHCVINAQTFLLNFVYRRCSWVMFVIIEQWREISVVKESKRKFDHHWWMFSMTWGWISDQIFQFV